MTGNTTSRKFTSSHKKEFCRLYAADMLKKSNDKKNSKMSWGQTMDKSYLKKTFGCPIGHESKSKQGPPKDKKSTVDKLKKSLGQPKPIPKKPVEENEGTRGDDDEETTVDEPLPLADSENSIMSGKYFVDRSTLWVHIGTPFI